MNSRPNVPDLGQKSGQNPSPDEKLESDVSALIDAFARLSARDRHALADTVEALDADAAFVPETRGEVSERLRDQSLQIVAAFQHAAVQGPGGTAGVRIASEPAPASSVLNRAEGAVAATVKRAAAVGARAWSSLKDRTSIAAPSPVSLGEIANDGRETVGRIPLPEFVPKDLLRKRLHWAGIELEITRTKIDGRPAVYAASLPGVAPRAFQGAALAVYLRDQSGNVAQVTLSPTNPRDSFPRKLEDSWQQIEFAIDVA